MQGKVKGSAIRARRAFVEKHFGAGAWGRLVATASPEDQKELDGVTSAGWYRFELSVWLDQHIVDVLGGGKVEVFESLGAESARENLAGVHQSFLKLGDPQGFMARAPALYRLYYDTGRRTWEPTGPASGVLTTHDAESYSRADCLTVVGWHKQALAMCGAEQVDVQEETCRASGGPVCRYRMSWRPTSTAGA